MHGRLAIIHILYYFIAYALGLIYLWLYNLRQYEMFIGHNHMTHILKNMTVLKFY